MFPTCISESCIRIPITDDMAVEQRESFFVSLQRTDGLDTRIQIDPNFDEKEVIIFDDDSKYYCWYVQVKGILLTKTFLSFMYPGACKSSIYWHTYVCIV